VHLPSLPGPRDLRALAGRGADLVDQVVGLVPRVSILLDAADALLGEVHALLDRIEQTRADADDVVRRTEVTRARADEMVTDARPPLDRLVALLDLLEPSLLKLQPTLGRLAEATDPREVDALVRLVDQLPTLADRTERDVLPVLATLSSVAPDIHDLLDVSRELNEMLAKLPGMGRIKKRVEDEQQDEQS
jgi:ABC-type transporter Mla subunit MlaD